ncbi:3281_t:CDS:2 [Gigaspora rosea]|nr:3281_t:CDS:2 [Gigaspora rosea]
MNQNEVIEFGWSCGYNSQTSSPSNPNLSDLTSDNETGEAAIYIPLKIVRTINEYNTQ